MNETSATVNELGEQWNAILMYKEGRINKYELEHALISVRPLCRQSGLPLICIDSLIEVLFKLAGEDSTTEDNDSITINVIYNLMPNEAVTEEQTNSLFHWFKATYRTKAEAPRKLSYWFIVCLRIGLIDKDLVRRNNYFSLFRLFLTCVQDDALCFLIRELTLGSHISDSAIEELKKCYDKLPIAKDKKKVSVLLRHYTEKSVCSGVLKFLPPATLKSNDKELACSLDCLISLHSTESTKVKSNLLYHTINEEYCEPSLSNGSIGISPSYTMNTGLIKVTSLNELNELILHYDNVEAPDNLLSILDGKCGILYAVLSSPKWQSQLEEQVSAILATLLDNKPHPGINFTSLMKALVELQTTASQGMPSVTMFLNNYFYLWDGLKFRNEIFELIPWIYFGSYDDLKDFMGKLFDIYRVSDLDFKCRTINAFGYLYNNLVSTVTVRVANKMHIPFISKPPAWMSENPLNMFRILVDFFRRFVDCGLLIHKSGSAFLLQSLLLYYQIFLTEQDKLNSHVIFTVLPPAVFLMCQTSSCVVVIDLLCSLLLRYLECVRIASNTDGNVSISEIENIKQIKSYSMDLVKLLRKGMGGGNLESSIMGQLIGEKECEEFASSIGRVKDVLSIPNNFSSAPIICEIVKKLKIDLKTITPDNYPAIVEMFAPHCAALLDSDLIAVDADMFNMSTTV